MIFQKTLLGINVLFLLETAKIYSGFAPSTLVATPSGYRSIGSLKIGDKVLSINSLFQIVQSTVSNIGISKYQPDPKTPFHCLVIDNSDLIACEQHQRPRLWCVKLIKMLRGCLES